jgi:hypothetical protein
MSFHADADYPFLAVQAAREMVLNAMSFFVRFATGRRLYRPVHVA